MNYTAVNEQKLRYILGNQCDPRPGAWYVIGPGNNAVLCQLVTCGSEQEARQCAETMNRLLLSRRKA